MIALLAALGVLLAFAAAWELAGSSGERIAGGARALVAAASGGREGSLEELSLRLGLPRRIERAGLGRRLDPPTVIAVKVGGAAAGLALGLLVSPAAPQRLQLAATLVLVAAGFLTPDALLERKARRRRDRIVAALPDALDLFAVSAASGRAPAAGFAEIALATAGPLAAELAATVAEIECGAPTREAVEALRARLGGAEVGALAAAIERSRRYGSPLAEQLHAQASDLRRDARRRISDRAARAAPKIQLVIALVLVPSVLLMLLAAIVAHSDALLGSI